MEIKNYYIGIDVGQNGGVCVMDEKGEIVEVFKTPESPVDFLKKLQKYSNCFYYCFVEKVHSRPTDGVKGAFQFGYNYGVLKSALAYAGMVHEDIQPTQWINYYEMKRAKGESKTAWKNRLKQEAILLYPNTKVTLWNADAILIANYCFKVKS